MMNIDTPSSQTEPFYADVAHKGLIGYRQGHFSAGAVTDNLSAITVVTKTLSRVIHAVIDISYRHSRELTALQGPAIRIFTVPGKRNDCVRLGNEALLDRLSSNADSQINTLWGSRD